MAGCPLYGPITATASRNLVRRRIRPGPPPGTIQHRLLTQRGSLQIESVTLLQGFSSTWTRAKAEVCSLHSRRILTLPTARHNCCVHVPQSRKNSIRTRTENAWRNIGRARHTNERCQSVGLCYAIETTCQQDEEVWGRRMRGLMHTDSNIGVLRLVLKFEVRMPTGTRSRIWAPRRSSSSSGLHPSSAEALATRTPPRLREHAQFPVELARRCTSRL
ncbi:uncharacterized protein B0H18DRAFT_74774 [Fomitopsis serialis]|uniref:uncharacterized protein n=1 Tax=Fomitopsis serialis TaxID=139415 RepID=UPI002008C9F3|nr:uncharacterized protein B0H18DRAFT_74774 [Neoantrodia serialis]KAH9916201.1 hypothetical protein B0H18DRAFT_74774 [Neoantrodia serialis]